MKLEDQVVSLELAEQLKEAGYPQVGLFNYPICFSITQQGRDYQNSFVCGITFDPNNKKDQMMDEFDSIVAPTVAELGEKLPQVLRIEGHAYGMLFSNSDSSFAPEIDWKEPKRYKVWYEDLVVDEIVYGFTEEKEANARAKMWLHLKKEGLL